MAEVMDEAAYVPHHPKKIAFLFAAMRKFAAALEAEGWSVRYTRLDDPDNAGSIPGELICARRMRPARRRCWRPNPANSA
jgi:deoxyribodipyrimidine photolyase-related protein